MRAAGPLGLSARAGRALIVAHRGAWGPAPENSLQAFARAIELGCDMVELDVRRTRDGRLVAVHDARIRGTAVASLDYEGLSQHLGGSQPPLLEEVLELVAGRIHADIELKDDGYVPQAMGVIQARLHPGSYIVTSFVDEVLRAVRVSAPETPTGLILRLLPALDSRVRRAGVNFVVPNASLVRAGVLEWAIDRGLRSFVWTVNDSRRLRALLSDARVEGVITDRPVDALAIRAALDIVDNRG